MIIRKEKDGEILEYHLPILTKITFALDIFFVVWNIVIVSLYIRDSSFYESIMWFSYWAVYKTIVVFLIYTGASGLRLYIWWFPNRVTSQTIYILNVLDGIKSVSLVTLIIMYGQTNVAFWISYGGKFAY